MGKWSTQKIATQTRMTATKTKANCWPEHEPSIQRTDSLDVFLSSQNYCFCLAIHSVESEIVWWIEMMTTTMMCRYEQKRFICATTTTTLSLASQPHSTNHKITHIHKSPPSLSVYLIFDAIFHIHPNQMSTFRFFFLSRFSFIYKNFALFHNKILAKMLSSKIRFDFPIDFSVYLLLWFASGLLNFAATKKIHWVSFTVRQSSVLRYYWHFGLGSNAVIVEFHICRLQMAASATSFPTFLYLHVGYCLANGSLGRREFSWIKNLV